MLIPQHKILELADDEALVRGWLKAFVPCVFS